MKTVNKIPLFEDLTQFTYDDVFYDLHNDFVCTKIHNISNVLELIFTNKNNLGLVLKFEDSIITKFDLQAVRTSHLLIVDSLYRGRLEGENGLIEYAQNGEGIFI